MKKQIVLTKYNKGIEFSTIREDDDNYYLEVSGVTIITLSKEINGDYPLTFHYLSESGKSLNIKYIVTDEIIREFKGVNVNRDNDYINYLSDLINMIIEISGGSRIFEFLGYDGIDNVVNYIENEKFNMKGNSAGIKFKLGEKENITSSTYSDMQYETGLADSEIKIVLPNFMGFLR